MNPKFEITFSSYLSNMWLSSISEPKSDYLSSLILIFDKVHLPTPYFIDNDEGIPKLWDVRLLLDELPSEPVIDEDGKFLQISAAEGAVTWAAGQIKYENWKNNWVDAVDAHAIEFIPPRYETAEDLPVNFAESIAENIHGNLQLYPNIGCSFVDLFNGRFQEAISLLDPDFNRPSFLTPGQVPVDRTYVTEELLGLLGTVLFQIELPLLKSAHVHDVLELRESLSDHRAEFMNTLLDYANPLEDRLRSGTLTVDQEARQIVDRELLKHCRAIRKEIVKLGIKKGMTFVERGIEIASIDAPITAPKFYYEAARSMIGTARELGDQNMKDPGYHVYTFLAEASKVFGSNTRKSQ